MSFNLRVTGLGIIGTLVKVDDAQVILFILNDIELIPNLYCMEIGTELSKQILLNEDGLRFCCDLARRIFQIMRGLGYMIAKLAKAYGTVEEYALKPLLKQTILRYHSYRKIQGHVMNLDVGFPCS
ncbi:hypothetical protein GH714_017945 [Hevea brasiliensis]|uniref:Uncharacterized protein n=1 Tax=Hevea brasiliensis TaxID=3981 RepID=A0A6A6KTA8_HEVBR|nr:hypothetical protein GH714_017945 [Hevea brasiliensis]